MDNTWEYNRIEISFTKKQNLIDKLNRLGAEGWEIIHYEEKKPEKFGYDYETIIIVKRLKPA